MDELAKTLITSIAIPVIKDLLLNKITGTIKKHAIENVNITKYEELFDNYIYKRYEKFLIIDTLVFPNKQTLLKTLYQPLTLIQNVIDENVEILIDDFPKDFLETYFRVIIQDTAGMGKSTVIRKMFLSIVEENVGIPFLIELRQINTENTILQEIKKQLSNGSLAISDDFLLKLLEEGGFIFLFDGYDEIAIKDKSFVNTEIKSFIKNTNDNYFIITSRPDDSLVSFGDFQNFNIRPLTNNEAHELIRKYDTYSYHHIADDLIKQLNTTVQEGLQEYLSNPFLVSLLYKSYEYKKDIPIKKSQFYRQVYDALFESHDLSKDGYLKRDKFSNLHIDDFERVLRVIGYFTSIENKVEYDKNYIINIIDNSKKILSDLVFKSSDFLKDLLETVPLFRKEGGYYKWSHKSLQDYFAAKFIWIDSKEEVKEILDKIFFLEDNQRFYNVLDIFYELDPLTFEKTILFNLLTDFKAFIDSTTINFKNIEPHQINERTELMYNRDVSVYNLDPKFLMDDGSIIEHTTHINEVFKLIKNRVNYASLINMKNVRHGVIFFMGYKTNIYTILQLVFRKYPSLRYKYKRALTNDLKKKLFQLPLEQVIYFDFDENNILNKRDFFEAANRLLITDLILNKQEALKMYDRIKTKIDVETKSQLLNW